MLIVCPKDPTHKRFDVTAHEVHEWITDETGEFLEDLQCTEVSHRPDADDYWICAECHEDAVVKER